LQFVVDQRASLVEDHCIQIAELLDHHVISHQDADRIQSGLCLHTHQTSGQPYAARTADHNHTDHAFNGETINFGFIYHSFRIQNDEGHKGDQTQHKNCFDQIGNYDIGLLGLTGFQLFALLQEILDLHVCRVVVVARHFENCKVRVADAPLIYGLPCKLRDGFGFPRDEVFTDFKRVCTAEH